MKFMQLINLPEIIDYIVDAPFFWSSMGLITAIGILVGNVIYSGDTKGFSKAFITTSVYTSLLVTMNLNRVYDVFLNIGIKDTKMAFAGTATACIVFIFYILGMYVGVHITKLVYKKCQ